MAVKNSPRVKRIIKFIEQLIVPSGKGEGKPLKLRKFQKKFIQDMLLQRTKVHKTSGKKILRKSFGLWADRSDITHSQEYVNTLRKEWQARVERVED